MPFSLHPKVREWFAEVQRRLDTGLDPFQEAAAARTQGGEAGDGGETQGGMSSANEQQGATAMGDEGEDEGDEEEDGGDDTDDSEVWEPSRSVRKSLSVSED